MSSSIGYLSFNSAIIATISTVLKRDFILFLTDILLTIYFSKSEDLKLVSCNTVVSVYSYFTCKHIANLAAITSSMSSYVSFSQVRGRLNRGCICLY